MLGIVLCILEFPMRATCPTHFVLFYFTTKKRQMEAKNWILMWSLRRRFWPLLSFSFSGPKTFLELFSAALSDDVNPLNPELNPICYLLALLGAHHFLLVSRIRVKLLNFTLLISYIYGVPILDVSRSHTTTQHSR